MPSPADTTQQNEAGGVVPIIIDDDRIRPPRGEITGAELRKLVDPAIPASRDLWLDVDGALDRKIEDDDVIELRPQMEFFSVPREINPGGAER